MNKTDLERLLLNMSELKHMAGDSVDAMLRDGQSLPGNRVFGMELPPHIQTPPTGPLRKKSLCAPATPPFHDVSRFVPGLSNTSPLEALDLLDRRLSEDPSSANAAAVAVGHQSNLGTFLRHPRQSGQGWKRR